MTNWTWADDGAADQRWRPRAITNVIVRDRDGAGGRLWCRTVIPAPPEPGGLHEVNFEGASGTTRARSRDWLACYGSSMLHHAAGLRRKLDRNPRRVSYRLFPGQLRRRAEG